MTTTTPTKTTHTWTLKGYTDIPGEEIKIEMECVLRGNTLVPSNGQITRRQEERFGRIEVETTQDVNFHSAQLKENRKDE